MHTRIPSGLIAAARVPGSRKRGSWKVNLTDRNPITHLIYVPRRSVNGILQSFIQGQANLRVLLMTIHLPYMLPKFIVRLTMDHGIGCPAKSPVTCHSGAHLQMKYVRIRKSAEVAATSYPCKRMKQFSILRVLPRGCRPALRKGSFTTILSTKQGHECPKRAGVWYILVLDVCKKSMRTHTMISGQSICI